MRLKRAFDVLASTAGLVILAPLFVVVAVAIKLDSVGPIFYRATRSGQDGEPFPLIKFRSMAADADRQGPGITAAGDRRVTRVGKFLRRTKIDELPQLFNVLKGEMSIVGPRPEDPRYVALYTDDQRQVLSVRPGLTSPASLAYRHEEALLTGDDWERVYLEQVLPAKLALDLRYVENASLGSDLGIIARTVGALLRRSA